MFEEKEVNVDELLLDFKNPRLLNALPNNFSELDSETKVFYLASHLIMSNKIVEMVEKIVSDIKYSKLLFNIEKIITVYDPTFDKYIVKEGNRRCLSLLIINQIFDMKEYLNNLHGYNGKWLSYNKIKDLVVKVNKISNVLSNSTYSNEISKLNVVVVGEDNKKYIDNVLNEMHVAAKERWQSADISSFHYEMVRKYIKSNDLSDYEDAINSFFETTSINTTLVKLKNSVRKSILHNKVVNYLLKNNDVDSVIAFNEKTLPIVESLYTRLKSDFNFTFNVFVGKNFELNINIEQSCEVEFYGNNYMVINAEELFFELSEYIINENVSNTVYSFSKSLFSQTDPNYKNPKHLNHLHKLREIVSASLIVDVDDHKDIEKLNNEDNNIQSSSNCIGDSPSASFSDVDNEFVEKNQKSKNSFLDKKYKPYELLLKYSRDNNITSIVHKIIKETIVLFDDISCKKDALEEYKLLLSCSFRSIFEIYVNTFDERDFFLNVSAFHKSTNNFFAEYSTSAKKLKILESMLHVIFLNNPKIVNKDFIEYWKMPTMNNQNAILVKNFLSMNASTVENITVNNVSIDTFLPYFKKYETLHAVLHVNPNTLLYQDIKDMFTTIEMFILMCEFLLNCNKNYVKQYLV